MNWRNIDPALPMLDQAFDSEAALQRFTQRSRGATQRRRLPFTRCRRQSVDYVPATRCTVTYLLSGEEATRQTIGVVEADTDGVRHRLFTDDRQLAGLPTALDVTALTTQFAQLPATLGQLDAVVPVRYKPGSRCTLRYQMHTDRGQTNCFGKLLAQDGAELAQAVDDLYRASQATPDLPAIAQPLAYWPELQMLVQAAVQGQELHDLAFDSHYELETRVNWLRAAGRAIAALHLSAIDIAGPQQTLVGDLIALDEYQPALRQLNPQLAGRFNETVSVMEKRARRRHELPPVLSHGALRTDQFMIEDDHLVLIDLDSLCWSSPARDLGNFLAYLTWKALRQPQHAAFIQLGQRAFLEGYQALNTLPDSGWLALYEAASLLKIIGRRYTGLTYREWPLTEPLLESAIRMMQV